MSDGTNPIVFISRHRVKPGRLEDLKAFLIAGIEQLDATKPRTNAFLVYLDTPEEYLTIVHVFPDADAMAAHVEGADQRSDAAYEFIEPDRMEILGQPADATREVMQPPPGSAIGLLLHPTYVGGFLRRSEKIP